VAASGLEEKYSRTAHSNSSTKTAGFHVKTSHNALHARLKMHDMLTTSMTSTGSQRNLAYPGNAAKILPSDTLRSILDLFGTYPPFRYHSTTRKRRNICRQYRNGKRVTLTPLDRWRNYMVSSATCAQLSQKAALSSPNWRPCLPSVTTVRSCLIPPPKALPGTYNGGLQSYNYRPR
jgi:hypothetical protein